MHSEKIKQIQKLGVEIILNRTVNQIINVTLN